MDFTAFRKYAHELVDWMADYLESPESRRVVPEAKPGEIRAQLPTSPPEQAEAFADIIQDFTSLIVPGMTHWNHPGWFAYFPANHSPPSILAEMLMSTIGAQCMSWQTSPAATELEQVVMDWLGQMYQLPEGFTGTIQDTASTSTLVALLSARERATQHAFGQQGASAPNADKMRVYISTQTHASADKAAKLAGLGLQNVRKVPVDDNYAMSPKALTDMIEEDLAQGYLPTCVMATVGTTSSSAIDPLEPIGKICKKYNIWLHVDGAYAGTAAILPEKRYILDGIEYADSLVINPHKWMFTNFDCSAYYVKDVDLLLRTFKTNPEYLKTTYDPQVVNFRDWGIPLGRRFRALKLWFVIRTYGVEGLQERLRHHIDMAQTFSQWVQEAPDFELLAPTPFGLVCFRYLPEGVAEEQLNTINERLLAKVNQNGQVHLTHTKLNGQYTIRMCIGQLYTELEHVKGAWELFQTHKNESH